MSQDKLSKLALTEVKYYAEVAYPIGQDKIMYAGQEVAEKTLDQIDFHWGASGFRFYDKVIKKQNINGRLVNAAVERTNHSEYTWIGKYFSLAQIADLYGADSAIYRDLQDTGCIGRVRTVSGYSYGVRPNDKVIDPSQIKYVDQKKEQDHGREM